MTTAGTADSTLDVKKSAKKVMDVFLREQRKYTGQTFDSLPGKVVCDQTLWLEFAHWIVNTYTKKGGAPLSGPTCVEYVRKLKNLAQDKFGHTSEHSEFFVYLNKPDDFRNWLKGALRQIYVAKFHQATERGDVRPGRDVQPLSRLHNQCLGQLARVRGCKLSLPPAPPRNTQLTRSHAYLLVLQLQASVLDQSTRWCIWV